MEICRYCNSSMYGEFETLRDKSYNFFFVCPECHSVYEGKKDKTNNTLKSRWWNPEKNQFEDRVNY